MPGYIKVALTRFQQQHPKKPQHQPFSHVPFNKQDKNFIQQVAGTLMYYSHVIDSTMFTAFSAIANKQVAPIQQTFRKMKQWFHFIATQGKTILTCKATTWFWLYTVMNYNWVPQKQGVE